MASSFSALFVIRSRTEVPRSNGDFEFVEVRRLTECVVEHLNAHLLQYVRAFFICAKLENGECEENV